MRIITLNTNGIRASAKKGVFDWLAQQDADVICIQETKAQVDQLSDPVFHPEGYHCTYVDAVKKGYSGVALYSRRKPDKVITKMGCEEFDNEGRYVEAQLGKLSVISLYAPSGSSGEHRQASKDRFLEFFLSHLKKLKRRRRDYIICGDWNIAHKEIDLKNWKGNKKNSGFLPHERAWLDTLFDDLGYVDAFREVNPDPDQYTWWSNRGQAWANNVGWRIDYQIVSPRLKGKAKAASVYKDQRFSDHAPLIMDYDIDLDE
ncbi:MAG TPA: exodeoxyribonuclease III [Gammaproteobacteria bacterium]|nr:exodeoxyribonuclease III [Gammaproteobacteria bacterium]